MDRDEGFINLVMEALEVPIEGRIELATRGGMAIQSVIKAVVKQAKRTRLLEEQCDAAVKLAESYIDTDGEHGEAILMRVIGEKFRAIFIPKDAK